MREEIRQKLTDILYVNQASKISDIVDELEALITTSNKALLRRVRESAAKDYSLVGNGETKSVVLGYRRGFNAANALWHQALNEEERLL